VTSWGGDARAVAALGVGVHDDGVVFFRAAAQELAAVLDAEFLFIVKIVQKVSFCGVADNGVNLGGLDGDIGIVVGKRTLARCAAEPDHEDFFDVGIPQPDHVEIVGVLKAADEGVRNGHARFHCVIKIQRAQAGVILDPDVVVRGSFCEKQNVHRRVAFGEHCHIRCKRDLRDGERGVGRGHRQILRVCRWQREKST